MIIRKFGISKSRNIVQNTFIRVLKIRPTCRLTAWLIHNIQNWQERKQGGELLRHADAFQTLIYG